MKHTISRTFAVRLLVTLVLIALPLQAAFSQISSDPNHQFYQDVERWQITGVIGRQPLLRPYSVQTVINILNQVKENGSAEDAALAEEYLKEYFTQAINFSTDAVYNGYIDSTGSMQHVPTVNFTWRGDLHPVEYIGYSYKINEVVTLNRTPNKPYATAPINDTNSDEGSIGDINGYFETNSTVSIGTGSFYFMGGISRTAYGDDITDSIVISPQGYHSPFISITYSSDIFSYSQAMYTLVPTDGYGHDSEDSQQKFLAFHALEIQPFDWMTFAFFESSVYGKRFDVTNFLPILYITSESFSAFGDNILLGFNGSISFNNRGRFFAGLYVDDINFNQLAKLNFDTRMTGSGVVGINYVPDSKWISFASATYTLVTPWMYSHYDGDALATTTNYQNYTNDGFNMATQLDPNSHRLALKATVTPPQIAGLTLDVGLNLIQHGNISESLTTEEAKVLMSRGTYITDGTVQQNGHSYWEYNQKKDLYENDYNPSYLNKFQFLEQETIMTTVQANCDARYTTDFIGDSSISLGVSYTFEYINNAGINSNVYTKKSGASSESEITDTDVSQALNTWRSNIVPHTFNNYLTLSAKIQY